MKAGDLRHIIQLLRPSTITDSRGNRITTYQVAMTIPAARADVSGKEFYSALAVHAEDVITYTIRPHADIDVTWRVCDHGTQLNILEVNHMGYLGDYIRLKCRAVTGEG